MIKKNTKGKAQFSFFHEGIEAGYISYIEGENICGVRIIDKYRGNGLGKKMMIEFVAFLKGEGYKHLTLAVEISNFPAILAYLSAGFFIEEISSDKVVFYMRWDS